MRPSADLDLQALPCIRWGQYHMRPRKGIPCNYQRRPSDGTTITYSMLLPYDTIWDHILALPWYIVDQYHSTIWDHMRPCAHFSQSFDYNRLKLEYICKWGSMAQLVERWTCNVGRGFKSQHGQGTFFALNSWKHHRGGSGLQNIPGVRVSKKMRPSHYYCQYHMRPSHYQCQYHMRPSHYHCQYHMRPSHSEL